MHEIGLHEIGLSKVNVNPTAIFMQSPAVRVSKYCAHSHAPSPAAGAL